MLNGFQLNSNNMRILSLIVMFVILTITSSAQTRDGEINRKLKVENSKKQNNLSRAHRGTTSTLQNGIRKVIDGITLGVSTKQDVIAHLKRRNMPYKYIEAGNVIMSFKDNVFGGVMWFAIYYRFSKNIVYKITYSKHANNDDVFNSNIDSEFSALSSSLYNKYKSYKAVETYKRLLSNTVLFDDGKTEIELGKGFYEGSYLLNLIYTDIYYQNENFKSSDAEL